MRYIHTPIRIVNGVVFAWVWNGQELTTQRLPIFRLKKPKPGMWRNGRILTIPFRSGFMQVYTPPEY